MSTSDGPTSADSPPSSEESLRRDPVWEALSAEALAAYLQNRLEDAKVLWHEAARLAPDLPAGDPRLAASANNAALAKVLDERFDAAEAGFASALEAWEAALDWCETMEVGGTARSSLFHHRLEVKHRESFNTHQRARYRVWLEGGRAASLFNRGLLLISADRDAEGRDLLEQAVELRTTAFGAGNPERALMLRTLAAFTPDEAAARTHVEAAEAAERENGRPLSQRWRDERPTPHCDLRRLLAACGLSALIDERFL